MLSEEKEVLEYIKEAFSLRSQKLYKPAIEMLYKALNMDNDNTEVLFQLGELYYLMHNYSRATGYFEQVLSKDSKHIESLKLMQKICEIEEYYNESLSYAQKLFDINKNTENLNILVRLLGKLKRFSKLNKYVNSEFANSRTIYEIANALFENNEIEKARILLEENKFDDDDLSVLLGKIYFEQNDMDKAHKIFDKYTISTDNHQILNYKGLFAIDEMNFVEAIKFFSKATSLNKNIPVYFYNLGNAYFFNGWMAEAQKAYASAIYLAPDNMDYRYSLCYLYYEIGEYSKCKKEVDAILSAMPEHSLTKVVKALLLNRDKEYAKAKELLEHCGNDDDFALLSLAKTYVLLDMFEKAEKTIQKVIKRNPDNLDYISDLTDIYIKEGLYDKAFDLAKKTVKSNANYVYGYVLCAKIAYLKGEFETAKYYAQEVLSLDMNCAAGYYYLALVRLNEKDYDEAIECMKRAITYDVNNSKYYSEMSKIYKEKGDYKIALEYVSEAVSLDNSAEYKVMYKELVKLNRKNNFKICLIKIYKYNI